MAESSVAEKKKKVAVERIRSLVKLYVFFLFLSLALYLRCLLTYLHT